MENTVGAPYRATQIAQYVIDRCYRDRKPISNLQLQKMLYFLQLVYAKVSGELLFSDSFEAWPYGPVIRKIYIAFSDYGGGPIRKFFAGSRDMISPEHREFIDGGVMLLREKSPWELVSISHAKGSPWDEIYNVRNEHKGVIPNELILDAAMGTLNGR